MAKISNASRITASDKQVGIIYETTDYDKFRVLKGNRDVTRARVEKIKRSLSIRNVGSPIQVNEKLEVIDGQGRLQALREMGLPVRYYIPPNAGIEDCRIENRNSTNWTVKDAIKSRADCGEENYVFLEFLRKKYSKLPIRVILEVATRNQSSQEKVMSGDVKLDPGSNMLIKGVLDYILRFVPYKDSIAVGGSIREFYLALRWSYACQDVDNERMYEKIVAAAQKGLWKNGTYTATTMAEYISSLEALYNSRTTAKNRAYLAEAYKKAKDQGKNWYDLAKEKAGM